MPSWECSCPGLEGSSPTLKAIYRVHPAHRTRLPAGPLVYPVAEVKGTKRLRVYRLQLGRERSPGRLPLHVAQELLDTA
jgi:hypothetical protein